MYSSCLGHILGASIHYTGVACNQLFCQDKTDNAGWKKNMACIAVSLDRMPRNTSSSHEITSRLRKSVNLLSYFFFMDILGQETSLQKLTGVTGIESPKGTLPPLGQTTEQT